jgi:hypothetical protein
LEHGLSHLHSFTKHQFNPQYISLLISFTILSQLLEKHISLSSENHHHHHHQVPNTDAYEKFQETDELCSIMKADSPLWKEATFN